MCVLCSGHEYVWMSSISIKVSPVWKGLLLSYWCFYSFSRLVSLSIHHTLSPLFSPKYRVCCAVLDHCSEELSLSATRQVSVTVPPTDTVSSEVTGCKGSSSNATEERGRNKMYKTRVTERQRRQVRKTLCLYENTNEKYAHSKRTNQIKPQNALLASLSLLFLLPPTPTHLFLCLSDYLYISICLSESTDTMHAHMDMLSEGQKKADKWLSGCLSARPM